MSIKNNDDVAVIGMAGRFPGANSVSEFWDNVCAGKDSIRALSDEELRLAGVPESDIADASYVKAGALLDDVDKFDPAFFKVSPLEAELMDPQIRLLLQCAWETLEDAGHASAQAQRIGVFAGAGGVTSSYLSNFVNRDGRFERVTASPTHLGNDKDFLATYLSYKLNLTGPSVTVQTACSTSLVALHQARSSLLNGECDMALAGGVTVRVPHLQGYHHRDGYIFSKSGRVRPFDAQADGVVFGSGLGLVLIKRLADAVRDGDFVHAVIKGSAIANDGKGKMSFAASSARGQMACVRAALQNAGVAADTIGFVESHGTGTAMGDPEEVKALSLAFKEQTDKKGFCALGAVKANIGHLEAAAGIVGFIKAVLAVRHGVIPPTAHYETPNPRIKFDNTPFHVNGALLPWNEGQRPRRAAVNSLGVGGTNAFVIVEQHVAVAAPKKPAPGPFVVPLSARTEESLKAAVARLAEFLATQETPPALADIAGTLQRGREAMAHRVAFTVADLGALKAALAGEAQPPAEGVAAAWIAGSGVDWGAMPGRRVPLPTYAFAKERCWIDLPPDAPVQARIHPLLHTNTSDLREQKYSAVFSGDEFFLRDHLVRNGRGKAAPLQKILPGVGYLEMARAAIGQAMPDEGGVLELRDLVWLQPLVVAEPRAVHIALLPALDFEVYTSDDPADDQVHCQGRAAWSTAALPEAVDLAALAGAMQQGRWSADEVYAAYTAMGLPYGPAHRSIAGIAQGDGQLLAELALPPSLAAGRADYVLHPSLMDGALQAATVLMFDPRHPPAQPIVPFALESLRILAPCETTMRAWARQASGSRLDVDLLDAQGRVCVQMHGFSARALGKETLGSLLATQDWQAAPPAAARQPAASQVILCDLPPLAGEGIALQLDPQHDAAQRYDALALHCFAAAQAVLASRPAGRVLLQLALPDTAEHQLLAGLSGFFKTLQLENPQLAGQIVLVEPGIGADALAALLQVERGQQDTLVRHAGGQRQVAGWRLLPDDGKSFEADPPFKDRGVYLITGGLGGLGLLFAREILARTPGATVVLTGRATPAEVRRSPGRKAALDALQGAEYRQLDLEDAGQVERLVAAVRRKHGQLNGVIHAAGMTADGLLLMKSADDFRRVLAPKTLGTQHLDRATRKLDLDFLVLFSSLSAATGNLGQADYAAANGFLDAFAAQRNRLVEAGQRRGRTLSIRWPLWQHGGMQPDEAGREMLHESTGIHPMQTATGLRMFYRSLALGLDQVLVMEGDLPAMQRCLSARPAAEARTPQEAPAGGDLQQQAERFLCTQMAALLKLPAHKLDPRAPLEDYGIDSILALDLTRLLEQRFGTLPKTLFFEYLTIHELAGYFASSHAAALLGEAAPAQPAAVAATVSRGSLRRAGSRFAAGAPEPIAIVGLSGRYPESPDLDAFWRNLRDGRDCIVEIPASRWDWRDYYSEDRTKKGAHFSKWGGFIEGVDEFDARFFNVSPLEAQTLDPQERLFLQHAWMAMEDAGCTRAALQPGQVGVYAGVMYGEYQLLGAEASLRGQRTGFASNLASIANRVSYVLNLHGPSLAVDTMCSSSLTAIHLACQDLRSGRTAVGIAGGVNVTIHPNKYLMLSAGQFISGDGHCQSFGEGGDGYIPGEGVGVVLLKRLSDALRDGNPIHGVIRGSALSHGGKTNGYTVPNPQAQAAAIRDALAEAGVDPRHVSYLEAHGTGTKLGDPIEIAGLAKVFRESTGDNGFCLVGSAKSNIGHAEAAAGIAGLTKVLLQLRYRQVVPSLHSNRLNPHIDFAASPFVVNQQLRPWEQPVVDGKVLPRIAGISSFGAGGSNAHLVVEEYLVPVSEPEARAEHLVPLSARTAEQLRQKAQQLADFLRRADAPRSLASIAWTLQAGREAMDHRLAVAAASVEALAARLQDWLDGRPVDAGQQQALAAQWMQGQAIDWAGLHATRPQLVGLPTYPFARQRHWVELPAAPAPAPKADWLHPLVQRNTSDFEQLSYASSFGDGVVLDDTTCREMARAAIGLAWPSVRTIELHDVATARPASAATGTVTIALFDRVGEHLAFEIFGDDGVVHGQGRARCSEAEPKPVAAVSVPLSVQPVASPAAKPSRIALGAARAVGTSVATSKPTVSLASMSSVTARPAQQLSLVDQGQGVFAIRLATSQLSATLIDELKQALHTAERQPSAKLLLLEGSDAGFLEGGLAEHQAALAAGLYRAVAEFALPLVAVVRGDASGAGFLVAALCDFMVCSETARLEFALAGQADELLIERFGVAQVGATAAELKARGWTCPIVPRDEVQACAQQLAEELASKSPVALRLLKQELASRIVAALPDANSAPREQVSATWLQDLAAAGAEIDAGTPATVPLESQVISALAHPGGILEIRMADRDAKNMFSDAFSHGLREAFEHAARDPGCKVVVLTGYDSYFSSGGTRETLLAIHEGSARFTDNTVFQLPLACPLPVIAAMQGHGIGAGWALGMYADATLFSDESRYVSPYMGYGFTPGAGTTLLLPQRLGHDLARETLMTAREVAGGALKARGLRQPVLSRERVLPQALALARRVARHGRDELLALKQRAAQALREALPTAFEHELAMHERTFVGQADTLARIQGSFGASAAPVAAPATASPATADLATLVTLTDSLRTMLAHELRMPAHEIGDDEPFVDLGLDSITGVTWIRRINETWGTRIEAIKVYSHPTLLQLARFVRDEMPQQPAAAVEAAPTMPAPAAPLQLTSWRQGRAQPSRSPAASPTPQAIAVIGMAGRFAKAGNLDEFWHNIAQGRDCITEVPAQRWDIERWYQPGDAAPGKTYGRWMGALDGVELFDAGFFNVSPREARSMDPQQRLFLQACWHAIEHAGHDPRSLGGSRCGVFAGCAAGDYHQLSRSEQLSGQGFTGAAPSILAARISYVLDLHGPSLSIDTACSSSLVAIASACDSLVLGGSDLALAGGVNVMAGPAMQVMTAQVGMLSPRGRCFSFDARADGIVNGEGVGVVMLKRLADAERDGDCIHGVIEAWGVNQDGRTNGITAPNADAQARLQRQVYERFGVDPGGIQLVEAHGTGTALGDPIEVAGLKASFAAFTRESGFCALGSVKSNIGHCLSAAGVSGFLKLLMALKHRQLPPTIHFERLNPHIGLQDSPFYVNDRLRDWPVTGDRPRRAAVNSFGFSGTNAHVVIAEHRGVAEAPARGEPVIVPLSARTPAQLLQQAARLLAALKVEPALPLDRVAYTLQVGRDAMHERVAFIVRSTAELVHALQSFVERQGEGGHRGQANGAKDGVLALAADPDFQAMLDKWTAKRELPRLAELWAKGLALNWRGLYTAGPMPRRIGLPGYPFAEERHWIDAVPDEGAPPPRQAPLAMPAPVAPVAKATVVPGLPLSQLQRELQASLAEALFMQVSDVGLDKSFNELGLDSIIGVEWVKALNQRYGTAMAATGVYDHPSVRALGSFLHAAVAGRTPAPAPVPAPVVLADVAAPAVGPEQLQAELKASLAEALFMQPSDVGLDKSFTELGLDSIIGVEWIKALNKRYGTQLGATRIYDHPSVRALAAFLVTQMAPVIGRGGTRFERLPVPAHTGLTFHCADAEGDLERDGEFSLRGAIGPDRNVSLREHVVFGRHLLPTDAYLELVASALRSWFAPGSFSLQQLAIANPLLGEPGVETQLRLSFRRSGEGLQFFVRSSASGQAQDERLHMQGFVTAAQPPAVSLDEPFDTEQALAADAIPTNTGQHYAPLQSLQLGAEAALGHIHVAPHGFGFALNPFALYGGLCTVINHAGWLSARHHGASDDQFLPYRIGRVTPHGALDGSDYRCHARLRSLERDAMRFDFTLADPTGRVLLSVEGIELRRVGRQALQPQPVALSPTTAVEPIAIIGMSCRFPKSPNTAAFWDNLKAGRDCVDEVPAGRWGDLADWYHPDPRHPHTSYSKWAGLLDGIDEFDALFFGISPAEAELIDPQQRVFLQECWTAIESAGYAPGALSNEACGVYVGCAGGDYTRVLAEAGQDSAGAAFMGSSSAILAARIAYHLNLKGPALAIDTACSSSLVAVHLACESLRHGENRLALAGGINLLTTSLGHVLTSQVGMPSRDGRCASFDASANGIVFSEGCGVLLLKPLSAAQRDHDDILGVIHGSGINQDGKTNGITAPSSIAQAQLLRQVYGRFGIDAGRIGYVEAHGTATPLGDPIEVQALSAVFGERQPVPQACAIGSVKSNIGHTGFAAGVAGIVKVLLCLKHRQLVPSIHYHRANLHIDFEQSPFHVNTRLRDWPADGPRLATVSSFGFSGTNAHLVIGEAPAGGAAELGLPADAPQLVPLSAKTLQQLQQKLRDLLDHLLRADEPVALSRLAYSLQVGRDAMEHRLAVVAASVDELRARLQARLDGQARVAGVWTGQSSQVDESLAAFAADAEMRQVIDRWVAGRQLAKVADLWVKGFELDLARLHDGSPPRRLSLPTYPFAKERCWVQPSGPRRQASSDAAHLHPLLHRNTSDLGQQTYSSRFAGREFFVDHHRVQGQPVLPAVAYLEMARAALVDALPQRPSSLQLELCHVAWPQPLAVGTPREVQLAVFPGEGGQLGFEVYTGGEDHELLHCQGHARLVAPAAVPVLDLVALRAQMQRRSVAGSELYPAFAALGLQYGPAFQGIVAVHRGTGQALVELQLPEAVRSGGAAFVLHPSLLDSALQGSIALEDGGEPALPFALESLRVLVEGGAPALAWIRPSAGASALAKVDIDLCDAQGRVCVQMRGFSSRPMEAAAPVPETKFLLETT